jgi:hypothetical protein
VRAAVSLTRAAAYKKAMRLPLAILAVLALFAPATASAQVAGTNAPPGNSAIDEYLESLPSPSGNTPTGTVIRVRPRPLAGAAGRALRAEGADGKRLEQIVSATAPTAALRAAASGTANLPAAAGGQAPAPTSHGRSPLRSVADAVLTGSGGGMGAAFPVLLLVLVAGTLVLALRRRRPHRS